MKKLIILSLAIFAISSNVFPRSIKKDYTDGTILSGGAKDDPIKVGSDEYREELSNLKDLNSSLPEIISFRVFKDNPMVGLITFKKGNTIIKFFKKDVRGAYVVLDEIRVGKHGPYTVFVKAEDIEDLLD